MDCVASQILTTRGVNSKVLVRGNLQRFMTEGHIFIGDFDGVSKRKVLNDCMDLEGISILWESSLTGYHVWNLTVRTIDEVALLGLKLGEDCKHVQHGYKMGKWVLRITPKFRDGEKNHLGPAHPWKYKPAPKLICTWCNESKRSQSKAHFNLFVALTGKTVLQANKYDWIGVSAQIEDYMTITDEMKRGLK